MPDYTLAAAESALLGQEFLTWLWYKSEARAGQFKTPAGESFTLFMAQKVTVSGGEGESRETASVSGAHSELTEARLGLTRGKKVDRAMLAFDQDGQGWSVQLRCEDFSLSGLKTPKVETRREEGEDPDGAFLEKAFLVDKVLTFFDAVYAEFLALRLKPEAWKAEVADLRVWLAKSAGPV